MLGLAGWSGSGKTTLLTALLPMLTGRGLRVSTLKHAHHGFDLDRPGKDSFRHRQAGAHEVLVASDTRWALMHEHDWGTLSVEALVSRLEPVDLVLIEGFAKSPHKKIEVHRPSLGKPPLWPERDDIVAVASDTALPGCALPVFDLNDAGGIADWAQATFGRLEARH